MPAMADLATGAALYTKKDYEHAFTELLPTAKDGDVVAQFIVGVMYDLGQYVAVDKQVAAGWYKQAADQGYPEAQIRLAGMLRAGEGMSPDREAAYKWALLATDRLPVKKQDGARAVAASIRSFLTDEQATRVQAEVAAWRPRMPAIPRRDGAAPHLVKAGTGVFLNEQGALLTDLHVVSACPRLLVSYGNATNEATIRTFDAPLDIAVLETPFRRVEAAVFAVLPVLPLGANVNAIGYALQETHSRTPLSAAGSVSALADGSGNEYFFRTSAVVMHGQSGGPVIEKRGLVIGLIKGIEDPPGGESSTSQHRSIAISGAKIAAFLDRSKIAFRRTPPTGSAGAPIPNFSAGAGIGLVECWGG